MNKVPYFKQKSRYTCSLAILRMVLAYHGQEVSEGELVAKVEPIYGKDFKNIWNPTIAKLACEHGLEVRFSADWPLLNPETMQSALVEYKQLGPEMNINKYENPDDKDQLSEPLPIAYQEMFAAVALGCKTQPKKLTRKILEKELAEGNLIQTSIKLDKLYPGKKSTFHSILVFDQTQDSFIYHDPTHGEDLEAPKDHLISSLTSVGAFIAY